MKISHYGEAGFIHSITV